MCITSMLNKKKYLVVKDAEKKAFGTNLKYFTLAPEESKAAWASFPKPPRMFKRSLYTSPVHLPRGCFHPLTGGAYV